MKILAAKLQIIIRKIDVMKIWIHQFYFHYVYYLFYNQ